MLSGKELFRPSQCYNNQSYYTISADFQWEYENLFLEIYGASYYKNCCHLLHKLRDGRLGFFTMAAEKLILGNSTTTRINRHKKLVFKYKHAFMN